MSDRDPTSIDWGQVFAEALEIAHAMRVGDAEDVVQEGMTRVLDGTAPFDPAGELTLAAHLVSVAVTARRNAQRIERLRVRRGTKAKLIQHLDEEPPTPEELTHERRLGERAFEALLAECADDEDVRTLVNLARDEDVDVAQGQADALGWDIGRVRNARKRMDRAVDRGGREVHRALRRADDVHRRARAARLRRVRSVDAADRHHGRDVAV